MRIYEVIFILKPELPEEEIDQVIELVKNTITSDGGTIDKVDKWGKRRLAYRVQRNTEGYYVLVQYSLEGKAAVAKEVERRLRVSDPVIKFLTVRIDEDLKRAEKEKAKRDKRVARKPSKSAPSSPSPGRPAQPQSEAPPAPAQPAQPEE
ncbi:MAG: 30S ribosomal protein S6 [Bryobacterales bacterium]